jgi:hypothetical protein
VRVGAYWEDPQGAALLIRAGGDPPQAVEQDGPRDYKKAEGTAAAEHMVRCAAGTGPAIWRTIP